MTEITVTIEDLTYEIVTDSDNVVTEVTVTDTDGGEVRFDGGGVWGDGTTYTAVLDAFLLTVDDIDVRGFIESVALV